VGEILRVVSLLAAVAWSATGAEWWNKAWSCRKRVRVRLAPAAPLGFDYRPPDRRGDEVVAAEAVIQTESPLKAGPANEVSCRVWSAGRTARDSSTSSSLPGGWSWGKSSRR